MEMYPMADAAEELIKEQQKEIKELDNDYKELGRVYKLYASATDADTKKSQAANYTKLRQDYILKQEALIKKMKVPDIQRKERDFV